MTGIEKPNALTGRKDTLILKLENRLRGHDLVVILAIAAISILFRVSYYVELRDSPLVYFHRLGQMDMGFFHEWGKNVADGDLLLDREFHPDVKWHGEIAQRYFKDYPEELEKLEKEARADGKKDFNPSEALWNKWLGGKAFHQEPLYGYIVGLLYKLFGPDPGNIFIFQMVLGVAANILIYLITTRCFGVVAGVFAASLAVFCGPLLFHEMVLLRTTLTIFEVVLLVYAALVVMNNQRMSVCFFFGALSGLAILTQAYFALFLGGIIAAVFPDASLRPHYKRAGAIIAGAAFVLSFLFARNMAVGIPPFTLFGNGAVAMIAANAKGVDLWENYLSEPNLRLIMHKSNARLLPAMWESVKSYDNPLELAALFANKIGTLFDWYEIPNNVNFYYFRDHSTALKFAPVSFLIVAPLGLAGIFAALNGWRRALPILLMAAISALPLITNLTLGRYRAPLLIALIPFAGYSLSIIAVNKRVAVVATGVFITMMSYFIFIPFRDMIRLSDYGSSGEAYFQPKIWDAEKRGAFGEVAGIYEKWFSFERDFGVDAPPLTKRQANIRFTFARLLLKYSVALRKAGRDNEAKFHERRADTLLASVGGSHGAKER